MLDQNTDRMWYVIGAVIIGAAIILILNNTFPQLFASIGETFKDKMEQTTEVVDGIMPNNRKDNIIGADDLMVYYSGPTDKVTLVDYDDVSQTWTLELMASSNNSSRGLQVKQDAVLIPYGASITISYEVYVPADVQNIRAVLDVNNSYEGTRYDGLINDNDPISGRKWGIYENGQKKVLQDGVINSDIPLKSGQWNHVWFSYSNTSATNTKELGLFDYSNIGVTNSTGKVMQIKIRDVYGALDDVK